MPHPSLQELLNNATALPSIPRIVHQVLKELDNEDPNPLSGDAPNLLAAILTIASWRAQILENTSLPEDVMKSSFPVEAAAVLTLDPESVFEKDPSEWTSSNQVALFTL